MAYVLLSGHSPFGDDDKVRTYSNITSSELDFPRKLFTSVSEHAKDFIKRLLIRDPRSVLLISFGAGMQDYPPSLSLPLSRFLFVLLLMFMFTENE